MRDLGGWAEAG